MGVLWKSLKCKRCGRVKERFVNKAQYERDKGESYVCDNCLTNAEKKKREKQILGNGKVDDMFY